MQIGISIISANMPIQPDERSVEMIGPRKYSPKPSKTEQTAVL